ncbi:MAG: glucosaminidase domain-containing protein [Bacteroidota bacterium]
MKAKHLIVGLLLANLTFAEETKKYTQQEYVSLWKDEAVGMMSEYKIPASITLAQGILESANGNSTLAQQANNHFGIKCSNWTGETYYKNDDKANDCFRKYENASQSYLDHSLFLTSKTRYSALFDYDITDYKSWAQGLKDAGYATNPKYPQLLIDIIEKLNLSELDLNNISPKKLNTIKKEQVEKELVKSIMANAHTVETHKNNIKYIVAKKGDTYYRISKEFGIGMWQLYKYNEFGEKKDCLVAGDIIYLAPKKRKSKTNATFEVKEEITLRMIAQKEGIKVQRLMKFNELSQADENLKKGTKIMLK